MKTWIVISLCLLGGVALGGCDACCNCEEPEAESETFTEMFDEIEEEITVGAMYTKTMQEPDPSCTNKTIDVKTSTMLGHEYFKGWGGGNYPTDVDGEVVIPDMILSGLKWTDKGFQPVDGASEHSVQFNAQDDTVMYQIIGSTFFGGGSVPYEIFISTSNDSASANVTKDCKGASPPKAVLLPPAPSVNVTLKNAFGDTNGIVKGNWVIAVDKTKKCPNQTTRFTGNLIYNPGKRSKTYTHRQSKTKRTEQSWSWNYLGNDAVVNDVCMDVAGPPVGLTLRFSTRQHSPYYQFHTKYSASLTSWCLHQVPGILMDFNRKYSLSKAMGWTNVKVSLDLLEDHLVSNNGSTWGTPTMTACREFTA